MEITGPRLRPRSVTDLIDATFNLYRANFALFAGVVAVLLIPETLISMLIVGTIGSVSTTTTTTSGTTSFSDVANAAAPLLAASSLQSVLSAVFSILILGALSLTVSRRFLNSPIGVLDAYRDVGIRQFLVLGGTILTAAAAAILYIVLAVVVGVVLAIAATPLAIIYAIIVGIGSVLLFVYVGVRMVFVAPAVVIERQSVFGAIARSWSLSGGYWWRILGLLLLVGLIVGIVSGLVGGFAGVLALGHPVISTGVSGALSVLVQPIQYTAYILLYYDQRIRKEGFDLEFAAQQAQTTPGPWFPSSSS
jgi:hypothetical protein